MRFALVLILCLTGCSDATPATPGGRVDTRVVLAPGGTAEIPAAGILIGFQGVLGDSRCPADAFCILGGDAIVRIGVLPLNVRASSINDLHTGDMLPVRHGDHTIALENLSPYPFSRRTIPPGEYRATIHVAGGED
jgi:hypothetical protein